MPDVFINYRTGDGHQAAATIAQALSTRFGTKRIYYASKSIPPGTPFDAHLIQGVRRSGVLLALIGDRWLGHPALQNADDWVRKEIQEAFLCDIRVIPVLIGRRTERPTKDDLPMPLGKLADCQSLRYDHQNDEYDLKQIGDTLATLVPELAAVDSQAPKEPEPGAQRNTMGDVHGTAVQAGTVNGDIGSVKGAHGSVHIGPSNRTIHQSGAANYVEGPNENGIRQYFGQVPKGEDDDR
ncbi:toll/interleukin-1 receptor domain-containing protein [Streptomyces spongiae]|uniref:Toll/interleukin-1 receptor domain-containing protein n=1 Tax=Streptomyces spongiae TaxID=565072 RepID=A0A5N8XI97_9ACTN|nr:toll/interleukin-1 receptor domain-containing protein [Streptomyces spongiae]MPY59201.1 toll/interleukin-1 receptor domain-containing protein [Streptomyces spongiae]